MKMKGKGFGRNLLYWGLTMQKTLLQMVAMMTLIAAFMTLMDGEDYLKGFLNQMSVYLIMIAIMTVFMNAINGLNIYLPVTVSLGSTRRKSFIALQLMEHVQMAEYVLAICILWFLNRPQILTALAQYKLALLSAPFWILGIGGIVGIAITRLGRTWGLVLYISFIVLASVTGIIYSPAESSFFLQQSDNILNFLRGPWMLPMGILIDASMRYGHYRLICKKDLQFA